MAEVGYESKPIGPVPAVGSSGAKVIVPTPPKGARGSEGESGPSSLTALEVALPDLRKMLEDLGPHNGHIRLTYAIDPETRSIIIKVIDQETDEVIREIPPTEMIKLRGAMRLLAGLFFNAEV